MGQRLVARPKRRKAASPDAPQPILAASLSVFDTELGWFGLVGRGDVVMRVMIGHSSAAQVRSAAAREFASRGAGDPLPESDWNPSLRRKFQDFARGIAIDFADVKIEIEPCTPFRRRVLQLARKIGYGRTVAYGELAARAGNSRAARAIGAVMASNPLPIIVPCHRVVASGGAIGGFSAPHGIELKKRLLEMEATAR
jgi:methylated-DNA-[protein]-cysteine S-methyltransferase